jgi:general secretion pathway protein G
LIELLVVISIIALLSSVVMVAVGKAREKAQISKFRSEVREFVSALEIYRINNGHYPECSNNYSEVAFIMGQVMKLAAFTRMHKVVVFQF